MLSRTRGYHLKGGVSTVRKHSRGGGKEFLCKGKAEGAPADNDYIEWPTGLRPSKIIANVVCLKYLE